MNILIIGNGFDLAHGLPTRYTDFLKYCRDYNKDKPILDVNELNEEFLSFVENNIWLKYFMKITPALDEDKTWIDFEKEIVNMVTNFESKGLNLDFDVFTREIKLYITLEKKDIRTFVSSFTDATNGNLFSFKNADIKNKIKNEKDFIDFIYSELRVFSRAFEIYCVYVNRFKNVGKLIENKTVDCVLSFNYTRTFERLYSKDGTKYCYIHGKAQAFKDKSNVIFGIDDSLSNGAENRDFTWVKFKKYHQRIFYKTGSKYKDWLKKGDKNEVTVHIVGHSLDKTDHDVLREFFDKECTIIIYYYNEADFLDKIQKVISIIGKEELIKRVHGSYPLIKFVDQSDPEEGIFGKLIEPFRKRR